MNASLLIIGTAAGVILGYALGFFFSHRNTFQIAVGLSDIENALRSVNGMLNPGTDDRTDAQVAADAVEQLDAFKERHSPLKDLAFYRVHLPMFVCASDPAKAYGMARKSLKKLDGVLCKTGAIDEKNVYVEQVSEEDVNLAYIEGDEE